MIKFYKLDNSYYDAGGLETIEILKAKLTPEEYKGFLKGNIIKYLARAKHKGDEYRDYEKASVYAGWLAEITDTDIKVSEVGVE